MSDGGSVVTAADLLAAAELRGAARERKECAALVCELCARGDPVILDRRASRKSHAERLREAIIAAFAAEALAAGEPADGRIARHADAHKAAHRRRCLVCRGANEDLCRELGAATAVDQFLDHRRSCSGCRTPKGGPPRLCSEGSRLRDHMRREACSMGRWKRKSGQLDYVAQTVDYPDEYFHVEPDGSTPRCAANAIWLRDQPRA